MDLLNQMLAYPIDQLPFVFVALTIAFTLHEFSHAYSAYRFGDLTAKREGRVSLNPRKHLDVMGTLLIFIAGFGWAKPVPVNRGNFKYPRLMGIVVSAAGPISNLLIAFMGLIANYVLFYRLELNPVESGSVEALYVFLGILVYLNTILFLFNLLPLPPLDGYRIVEDLVPARLRPRMVRVEQWGILIFLLLVFIPPLNRVTIGPLFQLALTLSWKMGNLVKWLFSA
ncbi:site-2 protease family protein [Ferviditalea candida]|uniref:Site-2 protease family protein n=1 Tax=Ferviditalea candida TaxID=3108399 RepID=A0ABU5ZDW7_9BACL|nr:site-2 protease family protein [Paenibacillaceae bacterium T2]